MLNKIVALKNRNKELLESFKNIIPVNILFPADQREKIYIDDYAIHVDNDTLSGLLLKITDKDEKALSYMKYLKVLTINPALEKDNLGRANIEDNLIELADLSKIKHPERVLRHELNHLYFHNHYDNLYHRMSGIFLDFKSTEWQALKYLFEKGCTNFEIKYSLFDNKISLSTIFDEGFAYISDIDYALRFHYDDLDIQRESDGINLFFSLLTIVRKLYREKYPYKIGEDIMDDFMRATNEYQQLLDRARSNLFKISFKEKTATPKITSEILSQEELDKLNLLHRKKYHLQQ